MQKFVFKMERVLRHRQWLEDEAKRALGVELQKLELMRRARQDLKDEHLRLLNQRSLERAVSPQRHMHFIRYGNKILRDIEEQEKKMKSQEKVIRTHTKTLNAAVVERKKLEKLRERSFEKYRVFRKRRESVIADENASNFNRRTARDMRGDPTGF